RVALDAAGAARRAGRVGIRRRRVAAGAGTYEVAGVALNSAAGGALADGVAVSGRGQADVAAGGGVVRVGRHVRADAGGRPVWGRARATSSSSPAFSAGTARPSCAARAADAATRRAGSPCTGRCVDSAV